MRLRLGLDVAEELGRLSSRIARLEELLGRRDGDD